ncbi:MAG: class B sortase [Ruminococcus sp.]|uniref:class B sortase n=1 Tax=Ruminococcus sp. TaxID=41978 RepID=UPI0025DE8831|nr:class B sortase [Ruminococcus sp.]MBR5684327.1 class B sortase [Ruminococcus sp.]
MSDKFNEESSEAQRRAEKIKAIRRSIHSEAEVAPTTYDNKNETERTESISDRIMRAKEKKMATAADILEELDAAIAYEKAAAAKMAEEAARVAEKAAESASPDISDLLDGLETPAHEELKEIAEEIAGDFTEVADTVTDKVEDFTEVSHEAEEEEIDLEEVFSVKPEADEEPTRVMSSEAVMKAAKEEGVQHTDSEAAAATAGPAESILKAEHGTHQAQHREFAPENAGNAAEEAVLPEKKKKHKKKKKKKSFKQRLIDLVPHKGDGVGECIRKIVFLCSIIAIVVCGYMVGDYYYDLWSSRNKTEKIMEIYDTATEKKKPPVQKKEEDKRKKYTLLEGARKLLEINPDIVGVISIPDTLLNNPVLQAEDNKKYLNTKYDLTENIAGEIFLDYRNHFDEVDEEGYLKCPNSDNLILYGHNMYDDQLFGSLKYYVRNEAYYGLHPVINLSSNYENYQYKIFAFFILDADDETDTRFDCWNDLDFDSEDDFYNFVNEAKRRTIRTNDVDVKYGDPLLTLSTCNSYLPDERARLIILARLVREGEDPMKGTQDSQPNPNIKWPTLFYADHPNEHYDPDAEFVPYGPKEGK